MVRRRQRAQTLVWVTVMLPLLFLPIIGLSIDAGVMFDTRRDVQNLVDGAARAGAQAIDTRDLTPGANGRMKLNESDADTLVKEYWRRAGIDNGPAPVLSSDRTELSVSLVRHVQPPFLKVLHVTSIRVSATGHAVACPGIVTSPCQ